jgi:predicted Zn-dependent peptidase
MNLDPYRNETPPRREVLPGGAVLLTAPLPTATAVTLGVWLRRGSQEEAPALGGISHFLEHMVFKGTMRRSAYELAAGFDAIGAAVDAFTTKDLVAFTVKVLPEYFNTASDLLAEMLLEPAFAPDLTALEQDVVCEEIQEALDTPEDRLHDAFASRIYGAHPRGRPILGTPALVRSYGPDVLRAQHARLFSAPNLVVSLAGNVSEADRDRVAALFGGAGVGSGAPLTAPAAVSAPARAAAYLDPALDLESEGDPLRLDLHSPILQTYFEAGNLGVSFGHADRLAIYLMVNVLGGGMSSRIFQSVREREGLAYTIYNYHDMGRDTGLVSCSGSCSPEKLPRLEEVLRLEYRKLLTDGLPAAELDSNKAQLKSQLIFSLDGVSNQMYRSARNEIYYGRFVPVAELVDGIDKVDNDQLMRCAATWFDPDRLLFAVHGPAEGEAGDDEDDDDYDGGED